MGTIVMFDAIGLQEVTELRTVKSPIHKQAALIGNEGRSHGPNAGHTPVNSGENKDEYG